MAMINTKLFNFVKRMLCQIHCSREFDLSTWVRIPLSGHDTQLAWNLLRLLVIGVALIDKVQKFFFSS